jgi:putative transposase
MKKLKAYKYRIYPNKQQQELLAKHFGCCRYIYNYALAKKIEYYTKEKKTLSRFEIQKDLVSMKIQKETEWLREVNSQSLQASLVNLDQAYTKFFREKSGFPKFKSKHNKQSCQFPQKSKVNFENNKLYVMKFRKGIKCKFHRQFEGEIKTVTISKTKTDKYFASILVEEDVTEKYKTKPDINKAIGIDLGIKEFAVCSNGKRFENLKHLKKSLKKLKKEQQRLSKKNKGSNRKKKQRKKVAKIYERITNQRNDFLHKVSRELIDENQINTYCLETLNVKGMMKNHYLAQSISDVGWSKFVSFITYKAEWEGKNILRIGRFEPSSKTCNVCGKINNDLKLSDREWICGNCNTKHNRDLLAACNIRDFAFDKQNLIGVGNPELTLVEMAQ